MRFGVAQSYAHDADELGASPIDDFPGGGVPRRTIRLSPLSSGNGGETAGCFCDGASPRSPTPQRASAGSPVRAKCMTESTRARARHETSATSVASHMRVAREALVALVSSDRIARALLAPSRAL